MSRISEIKDCNSILSKNEIRKKQNNLVKVIVTTSLALSLSGCPANNIAVNANDDSIIKNDAPAITTGTGAITTSSQIPQLEGINVENEVKKIYAINLGVPVLMYHRIVDDDSKVKYPTLEVTIEEFKSQMKYFHENGYSTITLSELYDFLINHTPIPENSIVITFDDGYPCTYKYLYPILKEYNMKADISIITGYTYQKRNHPYISWNEIKEMQESGLVEFVSHTVNHKNLTKLSSESLNSELSNSDKSLLQYLGKESDIIVYPGGNVDKNVENISTNEYKMGLWIGKGICYPDTNIMKIVRFEVDHGQTPQSLEAEINKHRRDNDYKKLEQKKVKESTLVIQNAM